MEKNFVIKDSKVSEGVTIEDIQGKYHQFAVLGFSHLKEVTKQLFTDEEVEKSIVKINQEAEEKGIMSAYSQEQILLAAKDISRLDMNSFLQFAKDNFQTIRERNEELKKEENSDRAIINLFKVYEDYNEELDLINSINEFSLRYKIGIDESYGHYSLIDTEDNYYIVLLDNIHFYKIVEKLQEECPELYELAMEEKSKDENYLDL